MEKRSNAEDVCLVMSAIGYLIEQREYITSPDHKLTKLKRLNIFIGANNSGKSRLMREMFKAPIDRYIFYTNYSKELQEIYQTLYSQYQDNYAMRDLKAVISSDGGNYAGVYNSFINNLDASLGVRTHGTTVNGQTIWDNNVAKGVRDSIREKDLPIKINEEIIDAKQIYIPIIRGIRKLSEGDIYEQRTVVDYKFKLDENHFVFSGQSVYEEIKKMLLGNKKDRKLITDFEEFLSINFFNNKGVTLVADYDDDNVKIDIGNGEDFRALHDVGDGIQSIIVCCFPAFKNRTINTRLYIEEPELTMHPSVQRVLIEVLINKFPLLQTFITTHSNHFLDLVYDYENEVSIHTFEKELNTTEEHFFIKNATDYSRIIDLIGLRNSSVFLANCVIWTEGVTDRMLLRKLLKMKDVSEYKEDYHYTFAEYGGLNLENYDFASEQNNGESNTTVNAISKRNLVIVDNDLNELGGSKDERIKKLKKILGQNGVYDKYIEIENLLPFKVWVKVVEKIIKDSEKIGYQLKKDIEKNEDNFNSCLTKERIGKLIKIYIIDYKNKTSPPKYSNSDTISCLMRDKKTIMNIVLDIIQDENISLDELGDGAKSVVGSMSRFISGNNENV